MNFNEIKNKQIINMTNGEVIGRVDDVVVDSEMLVVTKISYQKITSKSFLSKKMDSVFIDVNNVILFGKDCVLVDLKNNSDSNL